MTHDVERFDTRVFQQFGVIPRSYAPSLSQLLLPVVALNRATPYESDLADGSAYCCAVTQAAGAGANPWIILHNPPTNSKRLIVDRVLAFQTVPATGVLWLSSATGTGGVAGAGVVNANKMRSVSIESSAAPGVSTAFMGQANIGGLPASRHMVFLGTAQQPVADLLRSPFILDPNRCLIVAAFTQNVELQAFFEWREVPLEVGRV